MCGEEFPVGSRVGEGDLVFAQVGTVHKVVPAPERQKQR